MTEGTTGSKRMNGTKRTKEIAGTKGITSPLILKR